MGWYNDNLLPRAIDRMLDTGEARKHRSHIVPQAAGEVLEIGFGSGTNLAFYSRDVTRLYAIDPATIGRRLAGPRLATFDRPVDFIGLDGQAVPLDDASVDAVVTTWTMCTVPDPVAALREARRVLKPAGKLYYIEHGLHPHPKVQRFQRRIEPVWRRFAGGCHLTRDMGDMVRSAGFEPVHEDAHMMNKSPRFAGYLYEGVAVAR